MVDSVGRPPLRVYRSDEKHPKRMPNEGPSSWPPNMDARDAKTQLCTLTLRHKHIMSQTRYTRSFVMRARGLHSVNGEFLFFRNSNIPSVKQLLRRSSRINAAELDCRSAGRSLSWRHFSDNQQNPSGIARPIRS